MNARTFKDWCHLLEEIWRPTLSVLGGTEKLGTKDKQKEKIENEKLEGVALAYQDIITEHYDNLATDCFNVKQFEWFIENV